ncbi:DUF4386 domain-containing protein, partial [uncultured Maritalea sp.]|uniref:DUF4386 domain-containing protein n=1 Tax=uncultured Maritalea sp. TaxID=757249 RepID=UPI00261F10DD
MSEERTYSHKRSAITIAVLFIIATVVFSLAELIYAPILNAPDYLETIYPNRIQVMVGLLIQVGSLVAVPLIAVVFYPILRRQSEILALAYVVMRSFEALLLIGVGEINKLSLIGLSKEYIAGGGAETFPTAIGLLSYSIVRGDLKDALVMAEKAVEIAETV